VCWAILQHYGVCDTPLVDLTHSLRVAASFAHLEFLKAKSKNKRRKYGYVMALAMPYPVGSISYSVYFPVKQEKNGDWIAQDCNHSKIKKPPPGGFFIYDCPEDRVKALPSSKARRG